MRVFEKVINLIYPPSIYCICCGSIIDNSRSYSLCDNCIEKFSWIDEKTCEKCGKILEKDYWRNVCEDCLHFEHVFDRGFTCARYTLYERAVMMEYKYSDKSYLGRTLGDILYDRMVIEELDFDVIIPIPIHQNRMAKRGYNQAEIMAKQFYKRIGQGEFGDYLIRVKNTKPMKNLDSEERRLNVANSFQVKPGCNSKIKDRNVLLIDDIYTTGSTVDSAALLLKEAGANKVYVLTFAAGGNVIK